VQCSLVKRSKDFHTASKAFLLLIHFEGLALCSRSFGTYLGSKSSALERQHPVQKKKPAEEEL
jgi:hypothetical protein